ncbi:hypothetical protein PPERSA_10264 [Pseudocohnilembus persalinus]|uniref:Uncharacterized protein n=1 Tax=Pseudocohnilembus persalinus TaxID=266149 RepID=A0A0V0R023_PSEPJ|nr:hypothetical protein PPERSA_10264 [Pseudocohnilembus persalinus]|eukprot:KRX07876.1 hypothetical protein PPERSA_10264 [Pseudocohnilembus persalinus]
MNSILNCGKGDTDEKYTNYSVIQNMSFNSLTSEQIEFYNKFCQENSLTDLEIISYDIFEDGDKQNRGIIPLMNKLNETNKLEQQNHIVCTQGLKLLCTFLDHEMNREAELFRRIFSEFSPSYIKLLNLNLHIQGNIQKPCKQYAMKILQTYIDKNPGISEQKILTILNQKRQEYDEFKKWENQRKLCSQKTECYKQSLSKDDLKYLVDSGDDNDGNKNKSLLKKFNTIPNQHEQKIVYFIDLMASLSLKLDITIIPFKHRLCVTLIKIDHYQNDKKHLGARSKVTQYIKHLNEPSVLLLLKEMTGESQQYATNLSYLTQLIEIENEQMQKNKQNTIGCDYEENLNQKIQGQLMLKETNSSQTYYNDMANFVQQYNNKRKQ